MKKNTHVDITTIPICLSPEETANPLFFINQFFTDESNLFLAAKDLKMMIRSALSDKRLLSKNDIVMLVGFRDNLLKLVEAAWLLLKKSRVHASSTALSANDSWPLSFLQTVLPSTPDAA